MSKALETKNATDHGIIKCVDGWIPTIVVDRHYFYVDGYRVNVLRLGSSLGCDPSDVPSLGNAPPEVDCV